MFSDGRRIADGSSVEADICIIGAGAAGITLACELARSGRSIMVIEAGGIGAAADAQSLSNGFSTSSAHPLPSLFRQRRFGGTTGVWGGRCVPFDEIDFERRDHVPNSGWPFARSGLIPFYGRAMEYCEAGEFVFDVETAIAGPPQLVEGFHGEDIEDTGIERFSKPTDFGRRCRAAMARQPKLQVIVQATCIRLAPDVCHARITDAECRTVGGTAFRVAAKTFVIASGGLETVRLLLSCRAMLGGARNVGRYYMCQIEGTLGVLAMAPPSRPAHWSFERTRDGVYARRRFSVTAAAQTRHRSLGLIARLHYPPAGDPSHRDAVLSAMFLTKRFLIPEYRSKFSARTASSTVPTDAIAAHARNVAAGLPSLLQFLKSWLAVRNLQSRRMPAVALRSRTGTYPLDFNAEQSPDPDCRVALADELDRFGVPKLSIAWRMSDLDRQSIAINYRLMRTDFARSGAAELSYDEASLADDIAACTPIGGHHIGTARMASTAFDGVVDENCRVFGTQNVFVAGSAVFPTSSHANPTLTVVALAIRLAAFLTGERERERMMDVRNPAVR